ncbi:hypothetical protein BEP19_00470 [Ammoniphilus oxalaticus]|uniref:Fido domain-containing protein n=1 Tax=Ammoniphilus oxalaticus TaxID=66863 RepID=A0A419SRN5_9BACL|nr:type II toxin-antitoxin system death-on-curing family toxin [Ammoniphilus oxalaticus]RKD27081.1 hypothetical protein BEP19_00470 [Ammoniphilus oxalaticus]
MIVGLTANDIRLIHDIMLETYGGIPGIKDPGMLDYIAEKPFYGPFGLKGEAFPGLFLKAAIYMESIATLHCFNDAHKRTSIGCAEMFLNFNGYELDMHEGELFDLAIEIATKEKDIHQIAEWIEQHAVQIKDDK